MTYVHNVFFTCSPEASPADIDAQIADGKALLAKIPSVRELKTGRRDETMQRDVNITDYNIGLTALFDDKAGHDLYADHPLHLEYIGNHKANWAKVAVYDYIAG